jgi:vesicle-fusing ATPase
LDAYKSPLSCIVVDELERLLEYAPIGPRYSNAVLQTLLVFLKKNPPVGSKLLVLGTSSNLQILEDLQFTEVFDNQLNIPSLSAIKDIKKVLIQQQVFDENELELALPLFDGKSVPMRKLLMISENVKRADTRDARMKRLAHMLSQLRQ